MPVEPKPTLAEFEQLVGDDVVSALCKVMADLGGIEKLSPARRRERGLPSAEQGISYAYRGIDQIAAAVQPLLAKHGVVLVPFVTDSETREVTINSKPWSDTTVRVKWSVCGPNGSKIEACTEGWGRDNSDKGVNKAMTGAFKNLLLRLLCIGDPADDTDGVTHERDALPEAPTYDPATYKLFNRLEQLPADSPLRPTLKAFAAENNLKLNLPTLAADSTFASQVEDILNGAST